MSLDLKGEL